MNEPIKVGFKTRETKYFLEANLRESLQSSIVAFKSVGLGECALVAGWYEILTALDEGKEIVICRGVHN